MNNYVGPLVKNEKGIVFVGKRFIYGVFYKNVCDLDKLSEFLGGKVV